MPSALARARMLSDRLTAGLHAQALSEGGTLTGGGASRVVSSALAALIHLIALSTAVAGVVVLVWLPGFVGLVLCALLLGVTWLMRPRLGRLPRDLPVLTRESAPRLFGLLDRVAAEVRADPVDVVVVSAEYNAFYARVGPRGRRVLGLGAPLWVLLTPQERVALLAHELSHSSNGDARNGRLVGTALAALTAVRDAARTTEKSGKDTVEGAPESFASIFGIVLVIVMRVAGIVIGLLGLLLEAITTRSARRAEYVADARSARVAGATATGSLLDKLATAAVDESELSWLCASFGESVWERLPQRHAQVPPDELDRRRVLAFARPTRLADSHPPLHLRMEFVRSLDHAEPAIRLGDQEDDAVRAELGPSLTRLAAELAEARRAVSFA